MVASGTVPESGSHAESPFSKPNITIEITASQQESTKDAEPIRASGNDPSIPPLQASGNARVHKVMLGDNIAVVDQIDVPVTEEKDKHRIITPPWYGLRDIARIFVGRKYLKSVIEPTLADVQFDYHEAMMRYADLEASVIKWRGFVQILWVVVITPVIRVIDRILRPKAG